MGVATEFALRCDRCHHFLDHATIPMQLMAIFHASTTVRVPRSHPAEQRHRCRSCGYVNIFHPAQENPLLTPSWRQVSLKG